MLWGSGWDLGWFWFHFCNLTKEVVEFKKKKIEELGLGGADLTPGE